MTLRYFFGHLKQDWQIATWNISNLSIPEQVNLSNLTEDALEWSQKPAARMTGETSLAHSQRRAGVERSSPSWSSLSSS